MCALIVGAPGIACALDVALSNDDGWSAPGLQALRETFERAGHTITLAAPADQQSGSSGALNLRELRIRHESPGQFSVQVCRDRDCKELEGAEPATSALVAVDIATRRAGGRKPDLLISGINPGANAGGASQISGTVGAAIAAANPVLGAGVPAIAISTELPAGCTGDAACALAHYRQVAGFVLKLVGRLEQQAARQGKAGGLLPPGIVLNVNHPAAEPKGVKVAAQGRGIVWDGRLAIVSIGCADCTALPVGASVAAGPEPVLADPAPERQDADTRYLLDGYVTIAPLQADYTAENWQRLRSLFRGL